MEDVMIAAHLENLDRRLTKVEQILPTLATKKDLTKAISQLATKEELAQAIAPLVTKEELREALREEHEQLRQHMTMLIEHQDSKLQLLAEHVLSQIPRQTEE